jgi:hypothetical protein
MLLEHPHANEQRSQANNQVDIVLTYAARLDCWLDFFARLRGGARATCPEEFPRSNMLLVTKKRKAQEKDNEVIPEEDVDLFLGNSSGVCVGVLEQHVQKNFQEKDLHPLQE